jgi:hypothetical protein
VPIRAQLDAMLAEQRKVKALTPSDYAAVSRMEGEGMLVPVGTTEAAPAPQ